MPNHVGNRTYDLWDASTILLAGRVSQLAEHWANIAKVIGSIPTVVRHIFQLAWCRYRLKVTSQHHTSQSHIIGKPKKNIHIPLTHFFPFLHSRCGEPFWSSSDEFEEILISSLMWADHMRDFVLKVIKDTLERFYSGETGDRNYSPAC